jgi:hypothetical protein
MRYKIIATGMLLLALSATACGGEREAGGGPRAASSAHRPRSRAALAIISPRNGEVLTSPRVTVRIRLRGARIVKTTSSNIDPRKGHIHVSLDGKIVSMDYGLRDTIPRVPAGTHVMRVEFVASDHLPFDPRVLQQVAFEVKP